jgi:hypothetical protein
MYWGWARRSEDGPPDQRHLELFRPAPDELRLRCRLLYRALLQAHHGRQACLILELDEHSAAAGVMTRLEAYQNVIHNSLPKRSPVQWLPRAAAGR